MKQCDYCGLGNADEASRCPGCGTEFLDASVPRDVRPPRYPTWPWIGPGLRMIGTLLVLVFLYLLSFGPVSRYYCRKTTTTIPAAVAGPRVYSAQVTTITYPRWVSILYYPAFVFSRNTIYYSYLQWWDQRR